jgi:hypothetical protein
MGLYNQRNNILERPNYVGTAETILQASSDVVRNAMFLLSLHCRLPSAVRCRVAGVSLPSEWETKMWTEFSVVSRRTAAMQCRATSCSILLPLCQVVVFRWRTVPVELLFALPLAVTRILLTRSYRKHRFQLIQRPAPSCPVSPPPFTTNIEWTGIVVYRQFLHNRHLEQHRQVSVTAVAAGLSLQTPRLRSGKQDMIVGGIGCNANTLLGVILLVFLISYWLQQSEVVTRPQTPPRRNRSRCSALLHSADAVWLTRALCCQHRVRGTNPHAPLARLLPSRNSYVTGPQDM